MPSSVAEFDTTEETALLLQGHCTALTEYTGTAHAVDDPQQSKVVGKIDIAATPTQEKSGPAIGTFICGIASGATNTGGRGQVPRVVHVRRRCRRTSPAAAARP